MIKDYEVVVVKSRVMLALFQIPLVMSLAVRSVINKVYGIDDQFNEYGFRSSRLYVVKLRD